MRIFLIVFVLLSLCHAALSAGPGDLRPFQKKYPFTLTERTPMGQKYLGLGLKFKVEPAFHVKHVARCKPGSIIVKGSCTMDGADQTYIEEHGVEPDENGYFCLVKPLRNPRRISKPIKGTVRAICVERTEIRAVLATS